jgi:hypothetical protein
MFAVRRVTLCLARHDNHHNHHHHHDHYHHHHHHHHYHHRHHRHHRHHHHHHHRHHHHHHHDHHHHYYVDQVEAKALAKVANDAAAMSTLEKAKEAAIKVPYATLAILTSLLNPLLEWILLLLL